MAHTKTTVAAVYKVSYVGNFKFDLIIYMESAGFTDHLKN